MGLKVLIVEDNPAARLLLADSLEKHGHQVVGEAESLDETLKAYQAQKPDLVTLDLSLNGEDGITILKALLQLDPKAKVLVISANSQKRIQEAVLAAGAAGQLCKPYTLADLQAAVTRATAV